MPCRRTLFRIMILSGEIRNFRLFRGLAPVQGRELHCRQSEVQGTGGGRRCARRVRPPNAAMARPHGYACARIKNSVTQLAGPCGFSGNQQSGRTASIVRR
jgi:hypothetical protein